MSISCIDAEPLGWTQVTDVFQGIGCLGRFLTVHASVKNARPMWQGDLLIQGC